MKIVLKKEKWLADIGNIAYVAADISSESDAHAVHQTFDILQEGNINRVARVAGLAFAAIQQTLSPLLVMPRPPATLRDLSEKPRDYVLELSDSLMTHRRRALPVLIKELSYEFIVCMVIADRLSLTLPHLAPPWKEKADGVLSRLAGSVSGTLTFPRRFPPI